MLIVIATILLLCYTLIATEYMTGVNKAAVVIFTGTAGWVLLSSQTKFLTYVGQASEVVLFLLATMFIVEILHNNGCFDFISQMLKTRSSKRFLWALAIMTFLLSANLDNLTVTVMMLIIMHKIVPNRRQRMIYGSAILISANCGGVLTVIGEPAGLVLWNGDMVTPSAYSLSLMLPCLVAWLLPVWWIGRSLPDRVETEWITLPYRGDDTRLNIWQRLAMLFVGIGGLWFIPTFHNVTALSPFVGALCVLSVLWIVNEIFNHKLINTDVFTTRRTSLTLQYDSMQLIMFVLGLMLIVGMVKESGVAPWLSARFHSYINNVWAIGLVTGLCSSIVDNTATAIAFFSFEDQAPTNNIYWLIVAYASAVGGNILSIGSWSGLALMKSEKIHVAWYFNNIGWKALIGGLAGLATLYLVI